MNGAQVLKGIDWLSAQIGKYVIWLILAFDDR